MEIHMKNRSETVKELEFFFEQMRERGVRVDPEAVVRLEKNVFAERVRLFLLGDHLRHQMPTVARAALECAHGIREGHFEKKAVRKMLWMLDLSREPGAAVERRAIFVAMKSEGVLLDVLGKLVEANKNFNLVQMGRTSYEGKTTNLPRKYAYPDGSDATEAFRKMWPQVDLYIKRIAGASPSDVKLPAMVEDPSLLLGMGGSAEHTEELRKNQERLKTIRQAAKTLAFGDRMVEQAARPLLERMAVYHTDVLTRLAKHSGKFFREVVPVGSGKTQLSLRVPVFVTCQKAVWYVQPPQRLHIIKVYEEMRAKGTPLPSIQCGGYQCALDSAPVLYVMPVTYLSKPTGLVQLREIDPDLLLIEESDFPFGATRTLRLENYLIGRNEKSRVVVWGRSS